MIFSIPRKKPFVKEKILPESSLPPPGPLAIPPLICYNFIQSRNQRKGRYRGQRAVFLAFCAEPDRVAIIMAKVAVRRINEWDGPSMLKIYAPYVGTPLAPEDALPELQDYIRRIDTYTYGLGWLLCEIDSTPAGFCHLTENRHDPENLFSVEFQLYVKAEYQRIGVGRALWTLMRDMMELGNRREVFARIGLPNETGRAFFEAMGFVPQEEGGQVLTARYALRPADPDAPKPTKPYLLLNHEYEAAREKAALLVRA